MSTPYFMNCTVCNEDFENRETWLAHLLGVNHQISARLECMRWDEQKRKCALVVFSSKSLELAKDLLEHTLLLNNVWRIVTDFVWWPARRKVGLIQLESGDEVARFLKALGGDGTKLSLEDRTVHFKKAETYLDFEWNELIVGGGGGDDWWCEESCITSRPKKRRLRTETLQSFSSEVKVKQPELAKSRVNTITPNLEQTSGNEGISKTPNLEQTSGNEGISKTPKFGKSSSSSSSGNPGVMIEYDNIPQTCNKEPSTEAYSSSSSPAISHDHEISRQDLPLDTQLNNNKSCSLVSQFQNICKIVEIPDEEFEKALEIVENVGKVFGPEYIVTMYRNWYLKLRSPGVDILSLFVYRNDNTSRTFRQAVPYLPQTLLNSGLGKELFPGYEMLVGEPHVMSRIFYNNDSRIRFMLDSAPVRITESQMCRLVQYYCSFDPRVRPLITLIFVWSRVNDVNFCENVVVDHVTTPVMRRFKTAGPPCTMVWLVILFLCDCGILPTPRQIQERPHDVILYGNYNRDVGFNADPEFVEEWKAVSKTVWKNSDYHCSRQDVLSVLTLAKNFFKFYSSTLSEGEWVLNTRDGELLKYDDLLNKEPGPAGWSTTKLPMDEVEAIRTALCSPRFKNLGSRIYVVHPLYPVYRLSCRDDVFGPKMTKTVKNLQQALRTKNKEKINLEKTISCWDRFVKFSDKLTCQTNYGFWKREVHQYQVKKQ